MVFMMLHVVYAYLHVCARPQNIYLAQVTKFDRSWEFCENQTSFGCLMRIRENVTHKQSKKTQPSNLYEDKQDQLQDWVGSTAKLEVT